MPKYPLCLLAVPPTIMFTSADWPGSRRTHERKLAAHAGYHEKDLDEIDRMVAADEVVGACILAAMNAMSNAS